jgi:hypothetical protein
MLYAIKDLKSGEYFLEIAYHGEVGYYPIYTKDIENVYTHASKAHFDYGMLQEVYKQDTKVVPVLAVEQHREIETKEYYRR